MTEQQRRRLTVKEVVAEMRERGFDVTPRAIRDDINKKRIPAIKVRNKLYITRPDLETYIRERQTMPSEDGLKVGA
jgi:hypothetical protein